jgi:RNA polymerase sigma factor (sigma-70 family)
MKNNNLELEAEEISSGNFGIRLETKLKNSLLVKAREKMGLTVKVAAESIGVSPNTYSACENMRCYPGSVVRGKILRFYQEMGFSISEADVFPEELKKTRFSNKYTFDGEIPRQFLISLSEIPRNLLTYNVETDLDKRELKEQIEIALDTLTPREAEVINLYFGLGEDEPMTYEDIGSRFSLTKQRVRQIKEKAIRRLRYVSRSDNLKDFIE